MNCDFQMEYKLIREAPALHRVFSDNVMSCQNMLRKYQSLFPYYTDHTALHSLEVIAFCNCLIGDQIGLLNADEIFILLMAAYLHDAGMGITEKQYEEFSKELPQVQAFLESHPDCPVPEVIRTFHNEFSGRYIRKFASLFDFPSPEHLFAVIQVSRGHRKTDLYDQTEYPAELMLPNGNPVRLPYLAALIRLADELDIAADRNIQFVYDIDNIKNPQSLLEFKKHKAIRRVDFEDDCFAIYVDSSDKEVYDEVIVLFGKLAETLTRCVDVTATRTPFRIRQTSIRIIELSSRSDAEP